MRALIKMKGTHATTWKRKYYEKKENNINFTWCGNNAKYIWLCFCRRNGDGGNIIYNLRNRDRSIICRVRNGEE